MPRYHLQQLIDRRLKYRELERYQPSWVLLIILASCHIISLQEFQDMTKVRIYSLSKKLWITQKRLFPSQLDGQNFHSLSFSLTCPNLYQPYKYWRNTVKASKPKIKSTNFICFADMSECYFPVSVLFLWAKINIFYYFFIKLQATFSWNPMVCQYKCQCDILIWGTSKE